MNYSIDCKKKPYNDILSALNPFLHSEFHVGDWLKLLQKFDEYNTQSWVEVGTKYTPVD